MSLVKYLPLGNAYVYSRGCQPSNPTIGDTRTSFQILKAFSSNIKQVISVHGKLRGDTLVAMTVMEGEFSFKEFIKK